MTNARSGRAKIIVCIINMQIHVAVVNALALWCIAEEGEQKYQNVFRELTFPPWTKKITD